VRNLPVSEAPDPVPRTSVERLQVAAYEGPGKIEARVYELSSPGRGAGSSAALAAVGGHRVLQSGAVLRRVKWQQAERKALQEFVRELEERLAAG